MAQPSFAAVLLIFLFVGARYTCRHAVGIVPSLRFSFPHPLQNKRIGRGRIWFAAWLETLTPEFLAERVTEADGKTTKSRFERLLGAKEHEMHHRAQLMLIERQLGIIPHLTRQFNERVAQMRAARA